MNPTFRFAPRLASRHGRVGVGLFILVLASSVTACALGGDDHPGCRTDHPEDCGEGWTCRAGVCFRSTTPLTPVDAADALDAGASDQGDGRDAPADAPGAGG